MVAGFIRRYPEHAQKLRPSVLKSVKEKRSTTGDNHATDIAFRVYYDEHYLPWLKEKKPSQVVDAESRVKKLKEFFGNRMLSNITRRDVERFQMTLRGKKTPREGPRKGATVNRYVYLLSAIFSRAIRDEVVDFNP